MTRPMTKTLQSALDALDGRQRRLVARVLLEPVADPVLASLLRGLLAELLRLENDEMATLAALEADHRATLDDLEREVFGEPPQRTEGTDWWPEVDD